MLVQKSKFTIVHFFYTVFFFSGLSGLIYESIWTHYVKLLLGHAAYAQTLVLVIFMAGLAIGSWVVSKYINKIANPILVYAIVELLLAIFAIVFHGYFSFCKLWLLESVFPSINNPVVVEVIKWGFSAISIFPQAILLGVTYPLMSAGLMRIASQHTGKTLSWLYFTNSLGASVGIIVSGFVLIAKVGLPGTLMFAAFLNILVALFAWVGNKVLASDKNSIAVAPALGNAPLTADAIKLTKVLLLVAALTGFSSFIYEIVWIRMLVLILGSSTNAFELMLSAFIFGLALGGFWIRKKIDEIGDLIKTLAWVQMVMGLCALASLVFYNSLFDLMAWMMTALQRSDSGYVLFNFASHLIAFLIMLPATFCAGMTLPLITNQLYKRGRGEAAIGHVYSINTIGAVAGVLLTVHLLVPAAGLKNSLAFAAAVDIALGLFLLWPALALTQCTRFKQSAIVVVLVGLLAFNFASFSSYRMASGVYRHGILNTGDGVNLLFERFGKTSTVHVTDSKINKFYSISTNGKPDASIRYDAKGSTAIGERLAAQDEPTMILAFGASYAHQPAAKKIANIGFGSGLTIATALAAPIDRLDTVEIEPAMVAGAKLMGEVVAPAFADSRSHIHIDDAKTYFASNAEKYDIIISEPSNPWVSGVSSLFTTEFYKQIKQYIAPNGIFTQWLQLYEQNTSLLATVFKGLNANFSDYQVYVVNTDILIVASPDGQVKPAQFDAVNQGGLKKFFTHIGIKTNQDLAPLYLGDKALLGPWFESLASNPNSDYFPLLDQGAAKARFKSGIASEVVQTRYYFMPYETLLTVRYPQVSDLRPIGQAGDPFNGNVLAYQIGAIVQADSVTSLKYAQENPNVKLKLDVASCKLLVDMPNTFQIVGEIADAYAAKSASVAFGELIKPWMQSCANIDTKNILKFYYAASQGNWNEAHRLLLSLTPLLGGNQGLGKTKMLFLNAILAYKNLEWQKVIDLYRNEPQFVPLQVLAAHASKELGLLNTVGIKKNMVGKVSVINE